MNKSVKIQEALINHRLFAAILDIVSLVIGTIILYFILIYTVFNFGFGYTKLNDKANFFEEKYSLNLESGLEYTEYEKVIKKIYLEYFPEEISTHYKLKYGDDFSAAHIYNIAVLKLPVNPTYDNYKTDLHQYVQNSDGSFNVDVVAKQVEGSGINYDNNIESLFYNAYLKMPIVVEQFEVEYYTINANIYHLEVYARMIAFGIMFILIYIIFPLTNKEATTFWGKKFDLGFINLKNGYYVKKWKIIVRNIISNILPFIGISIANKYSIIILFVGFVLLDSLLMLFSKDNLGIADKILRIETCAVKESLLFKNKEEEEQFMNSDEGRRVEDVEYLSKLENAEEIIIVNYEGGEI